MYQQTLTNRRGSLRRFIPNIKMGSSFLVLSLIFFVTLITVITLMFSTRQVTKGYVLNKLESQHQTLIRESERNQMSISQVRALNHIKDSRQIRRMVRPENIAYVSGDSAIASR